MNLGTSGVAQGRQIDFELVDDGQELHIRSGGETLNRHR